MKQSTMMQRLSPDTLLPDNVATPQYRSAEHGVGIVHLGIGAFHRAHQAVYTDDALQQQGGDWRIAAISLRSDSVARALNPQRGLYSVLVREGSESHCRVVGSIGSVTALRNRECEDIRDSEFTRMMQLLTAENTKIVTLTVTEKAYGIDRNQRRVDPNHPAIMGDLANPDKPTGVIGILVRALKLRQAAGVTPFTVLCCDNLPENGTLIRSGVIDFASRIDPGFAEQIATDVSFPNTMVDRITPASTDKLLSNVENILGVTDKAAVETESFSQWVVEDSFPTGRPAWEAGGAQFVTDVAPYEMMKLRMLNGTHSLIAYAGYTGGYRYVRDAMQSTEFVRVIRAFMHDASLTLPALDDMDYSRYAASLEQRFSNRAIAHQTYQIAMDGTQKLPQRILEPALKAQQSLQSIESFAFAFSAWMYFCCGVDDQGNRYKLRDPREDEIVNRIRQHSNNASGVYNALSTLPNLVPPQLAENSDWRSTVVSYLEEMMQLGMQGALSKRCIMI